MQIKTTMRHHLTWVRLAIIKKSTSNTSEKVWKKGNPGDKETAGDNVNWSSHYEKQRGGSSNQLKIEVPYDPAIPLLGIPRQNYNSKRYTYPNVCSSTNSQDMETTWMSTDRGMDKEDVVHTVKYYSAIKKNEIVSFTATWMDPRLSQ